MSIIRKSYRKFIKTLYKYFPVFTTRVEFFLKTKKLLKLNNPKTFNDKIQYLKIHNHNNLKSICSDKYQVRQYIKEKKLDHILNKLIGVYDNANDIEWDKLPNKFVIKCNHGSGYNIICTDKNKLDISKTCKKLNKWMKTKYGLTTGEFHYDFIIPKIIIENYLEERNSKLPVDYKIFCFNGKAHFIMVIKERENSATYKRYFFDLDWNLLQVTKKIDKKTCFIEKPKNLSEMITIANILSEGFHFVRVDFYEINNEIIFGEMTFTPVSGMANYYSNNFQAKLGDLININEKRL